MAVAVPADAYAEPALDADTLRRSFLDKLFSIQGKFPELATPHDYYLALAYTVRDLMLRRWVATAAVYTRQRARTVSNASRRLVCVFGSAGSVSK